jgi:hypothetical protein
MTPQEFTRLRTLELSLRRAFRPSKRVVSRRQAKSQSNATGQVLRHSRVQTQVGLNKVFVYY